MQHVRHGLPFCCWPGAQARPHCLLHAILWRRDVWDALTRGRPGSRVLAKVLTPTRLAFALSLTLLPQVCRGKATNEYYLDCRSASTFELGYTDCQNEIFKRVEQ